MITLLRILFLALTLPIIGCGTHASSEARTPAIPMSDSAETDTLITFTEPSTGPNRYNGFNAPQAINRIAEMENEYFNAVEDSASRYYGTVWRQNAELDTLPGDSVSTFDRYRIVFGHSAKPDSLHCTLYAMEGLATGLGDQFSELERLHQEGWGNREYAGWSVGHLLVEHFGWSAWLVVDKSSPEYAACLRNFKKDRTYHVWKQPNIRLSGLLDFHDDQMEIDSLLNLHEFSWGFSYQGWHTWITRFAELKECNWVGSPGKQFSGYGNQVLFKSTPFLEYVDYASHVLVFPPLKTAQVEVDEQG